MQYVSVQYTRYYKLDASYVKSDLLVIHHLLVIVSFIMCMIS